MAALLAAPGNSRKILIRGTTIMVILYNSAIRLSVLLDLRKNDVNLSGKDSLQLLMRSSVSLQIRICNETQYIPKPLLRKGDSKP